MTNRERMWLKIGIGVAFVAALVALCFPTVNRASGTYRRVNCQSGIQQIGLGFSQYAQDFDGRYPLTTQPEGWVGALHFYLKSERIFQCPAETRRDDDNLTDYWFNRRLAGGQIKAVVAPNRTFLAGDGEPSDDPNISLQLMSPLWLEKSNSPARRHLDGAVYLFVDGHAKWLSARKMGAAKADGKTPTFLPGQFD